MAKETHMDGTPDIQSPLHPKTGVRKNIARDVDPCPVFEIYKQDDTGSQGFYPMTGILVDSPKNSGTGGVTKI